MSLPVAVAFGAAIIAAAFVIWFLLATALPVAVRIGSALTISLVTLAVGCCLAGIVVLVVTLTATWPS